MNETDTISLKYVNVNLGSSFEQTCLDLHPQCYIPRFKVIWFLYTKVQGHLVLNNEIFLKVFTIYGYGCNIDHVNSIR